MPQDNAQSSLSDKCAPMSKGNSDRADISVSRVFFRPKSSETRCATPLVFLAFALVIGLLWLRVEFLAQAHQHIDDKGISCTQRLAEQEEKIQRQDKIIRHIINLLPEKKKQTLSQALHDEDYVKLFGPDISRPQDAQATESRAVQHKVMSSRRKRATGSRGCSQCVTQQQFESLYSRVRRTAEGGHPSAQLVPDDYTDSTTDMHNGANLKWTDIGPLSNSILAHNTHIFTVHADGKLEIIASAVYFMYMKITFNGRNQPHHHRQPPHCTVKMNLYRNGADPPSILMTSTVTQIEWGRHLGQRQGQYVYAYDSTQQIGTYRLARGDVITVKPADNSHQCRVAMHPEKTYVGAVLLRY